MELLPRDHESGQVGGVQGEEYHGEESPGAKVIKRYFSVADDGENKLERLSLASFFRALSLFSSKTRSCLKGIQYG